MKTNLDGFFSSVFLGVWFFFFLFIFPPLLGRSVNVRDVQIPLASCGSCWAVTPWGEEEPTAAEACAACSLEFLQFYGFSRARHVWCLVAICQLCCLERNPLEDCKGLVKANVIYSLPHVHHWSSSEVIYTVFEDAIAWQIAVPKLALAELARCLPK